MAAYVLALALLATVAVITARWIGRGDRRDDELDSGPAAALELDALEDGGALEASVEEADADLGRDVDAPDAISQPRECEEPSDCVISMNFNVCCPCAIAMPSTSLERSDCIIEIEDEMPTRPPGCGLGCDGSQICQPCHVRPNGADCVEGRCVTRYPGACQPGDSSCRHGLICALRDGGAECVDDPSECHTDGECPRGLSCRDWLYRGVLFCWHPASRCFDDVGCPYGLFCDDPEGDGVYECISAGGDCQVLRAHVECPQTGACDDSARPPDGDGRGRCIAE